MIYPEETAMTTAAFHLWSLTNKRSQPPNNMKKRKLMAHL